VTAFDPARLAAELRRAEREHCGIELPTARFDDFSWRDARRTALARDELRRADGEHRIGYKLGWTSAVMRGALGIDRPNWGSLWDSQRLGPDVDLASLIHAKVEPEIVYVAARPLVGQVSPDEVIDAAAGWAVGLEVVDPRFPSFEFDWLDNTADNSSAAGIRMGPVVASDGDPAAWTIEFDDGETVRTGSGAAAMESPAAAVSWLVGELDREGGAGLGAGEIVFTGGLAAPFDLTAARRYSVRSDRLGQTSFTVGRRDGDRSP
jgi:2-keto-4-pentenoate hydratase